MKSAQDFAPALRSLLEESLENSYTDNHWLFYHQGVRRVQHLDAIALENFPLEQRRELIKKAEKDISAIIAAMAPLYARLANEASRRVLLLVAAYRVLGYRHVKFPYYREDTIALRERAAARTRMPDPGALSSFLTELRQEWNSDSLALYVLQPLDRPMALYSSAESLYMELYAPAYRYKAENILIEAAPGDLVVDCGAGLGDQALFFAAKVGPEGLVLGLEPHPGNRKLCRENMRLNPELGKRLRVLSNGAWDEDGVLLELKLRGASSALDPNGHGEIKVRCRRIDKLLEEMPRQDLSFLKMDIEGAECEALRGAAQSIARHKPKLAISIYHHLEDFYRIPQCIDAICPSYNFYLDHHSMDFTDTVLYAATDC